MEENPFPDFKIDSSSFLDDLNSRSKCSKCQKSRKFYCYTCYLSVPEIANKVPKVQLPLKVDIIKHPGETDGKSTAVHAGVISPDDVTIYTYPCIPDYDKDKVVLVFPNESSKTLDELAKSWTNNSSSTKTSPDVNRKSEVADNDDEPLAKVPRIEVCSDVYDSDNEVKDKGENTEDKHDVANAISETNYSPIDRVIFIDSTWNQTKTICNDERLKDLQCVELRTQKTKFWRHQKDIPDTYLSTIEAIYYFLREYHDSFVTEVYTGQYDNLLFFFKFMYSKIRTMYDGGKDLKAYKSRKERQAKEN